MTGYHRQAIVILGMHRSGTSALAGLTARLGLATPHTPLPAATDNPAGFYESLPVVNVNHQLLRAAHCAWNLCFTFEPDRLEQMLGLADRQIIFNTLQQEFDGTPSYVLKDPRLCLMLPAWLPALRATTSNVRVLIIVRHPAEVVRSLLVRNHFPENETALQWLHHMIEAERASRGMKRAIVFYEELLRNWRSCITEAARFASITWPRPIELAESDIDVFLASSTRRRDPIYLSAAVGPEPVGNMIDAAWNELLRLGDNPDAPAALARLDDIRSHFADWRRAAFPSGLDVVLPAS
jgi:hypothetical protein